MALRVECEALNSTMEQFARLSEAAHQIAAVSMYEGAKIMADAIAPELDALITEPFHRANPDKGQTRYPSPREVELVKGARYGISRFQGTGAELETSIGFSNTGYAELGGKQVPIPMIAASINSGTSFMHKQPFFRRAVNRAKDNAQAAILQKGENMIAEIRKK